MKPGAGKAKGNNYEGQTAKKLTKALAPLTFIRSPGSGARLGGKNFATFGAMFGEEATKLFVGDVVPTNEKDCKLTFKFSVECKSYKTPDNFPALVSGNANVFKWFEESVVDAEKINKLPMLVWKWNHTPSFAAVLHNPNALLKPRFSIIQQRHLDIYDLDELLTVPDFWMEANVSG